MIKRIVDILVSSLLLISTSPLMFLIAWQIRWKMGAPILFKQVRPGLNGQLFELIKFRTMSNDVDLSEVLLSDKRRITSLGRFLRSTSLDELPELWNVLKGDMSLVGPRPLLPEYLPLYNEEQRRRHNVLPGITGWAQINGRNAISWEEKFKLDLWYVDNHSVGVDLKILFLTIQKVILRTNITSTNCVTANKFEGS